MVVYVVSVVRDEGVSVRVFQKEPTLRFLEELREKFGSNVKFAINEVEVE